MKTKFLTTVIALLFLGISAQAGIGKENTKAKTISLEQQISKSLTYPRVLNYMGQQEISLNFTINENFELQVKSVKSTDARLKAHVLKQLSNTKLMTDSSSVHKNYSIKLIFK